MNLTLALRSCFSSSSRSRWRCVLSNFHLFSRVFVDFRTSSRPCTMASHSLWISVMWWGQLVTSPLWAWGLSSEHLLEMARTHTRGRQQSLTTRLWDFTLLSLPFPPPSHNQPFGLPYPTTVSCGKYCLYQARRLRRPKPAPLGPSEPRFATRRFCSARKLLISASRGPPAV